MRSDSYLESIKDYVRIHTDQKNVITKDKISDFEKKLPDNFIRVHRSFIININKITAFTAHDVEIEDREIPIGGSYKKEVFNRLECKFARACNAQDKTMVTRLAALAVSHFVMHPYFFLFKPIT